MNSPVMSSTLLPVANVIAAIPCNSSLVNPAISLISVRETNISESIVVADVPNDEFIELNVSTNFAPVIKFCACPIVSAKSPALLATPDSSALTFRASL